MIDELRAALDRLQQQSEDTQRRVVAVVNDELDWQEHERTHGALPDAAEPPTSAAEGESNTGNHPDQPRGSE